MPGREHSRATPGPSASCSIYIYGHRGGRFERRLMTTYINIVKYQSPVTNSSLIIFKNIQRKNHLLKPKNKITSGVVSESHSLWTKRHFVPPKYITFAKKVIGIDLQTARFVLFFMGHFWNIPFLNQCNFVWDTRRICSQKQVFKNKA